MYKRFWVKMSRLDIDIVVSYLDDQTNIVSQECKDQCKTEEIPSSISAIGRYLLAGAQLPLNSQADNDKCSCKLKPCPCIFIHDFKVKSEFPVLRAKSDNGEILLQTIHRAAQKYNLCSWILGIICQEDAHNRALVVNNTSTKTIIKNTIIVTNSMGDFLLAGATDNKNARWIQVHLGEHDAPLYGTMASDLPKKYEPKAPTCSPRN
ncbi:hypothetical protein CCR75_003983 [Bremia lactucae]|uniref:Uncharacterized protein n=1 Tax=Bremia lactucae TaxID=4779 RepID=A0A976FNM9_BRELC|nr:hypothetical protein CCR75_003983 [Bremia lactucae]